LLLSFSASTTDKAKGRPMLPAAFDFQIYKKEKPWEIRAAGLPWFSVIRSDLLLTDLFPRQTA